MSQSSNHDGSRDEEATRDDTMEWFAASTLRIGLTLTGIILLLFALGQAVGMDLLGLVGDALSTNVGRWLVVAFFALVLIVVALRGFGNRA